SWNDRWYVFSAWIRTAFLSSCSLYPQKETPAIPSDNKTIAIHLPIKSHPFYLQNICFPILLICGLDHIHSDVAVSGLKLYMSFQVGSQPFTASSTAFLANSFVVNLICLSSTAVVALGSYLTLETLLV